MCLCYAHCAFRIVKDVADRVITPNDVILFLMTAIPLAVSYSIFFMWIITELKETTRKLEIRRQTTKLNMYRLLSKVLICVFGVISLMTIIITSVSLNTTVDWYSSNWKSIWLLQSGWSTIVEFLAFNILIYIWRPRANNRRFVIKMKLISVMGYKNLLQMRMMMHFSWRNSE
jgi:hypothetical protein